MTDETVTTLHATLRKFAYAHNYSILGTRIMAAQDHLPDDVLTTVAEALTASIQCQKAVLAALIVIEKWLEDGEQTNPPDN